MLSIESPCHPPTGALHRLGRPLFQLGQRHAQLKICSPSLVICLYHETPLHGRLHDVVGSRASSLPPTLQSNKTCHLLVFTNTASVVISREVCAPPARVPILPPDEVCNPFLHARQAFLPSSPVAAKMCNMKAALVRPAIKYQQ